jgi:hypothetical protein
LIYAEHLGRCQVEELLSRLNALGLKFRTLLRFLRPKRTLLFLPDFDAPSGATILLRVISSLTIATIRLLLVMFRDGTFKLSGISTGREDERGGGLHGHEGGESVELGIVGCWSTGGGRIGNRRPFWSNLNDLLRPRRCENFVLRVHYRTAVAGTKSCAV